MLKSEKGLGRCSGVVGKGFGQVAQFFGRINQGREVAHGNLSLAHHDGLGIRNQLDLCLRAGHVFFLDKLHDGIGVVLIVECQRCTERNAAPGIERITGGRLRDNLVAVAIGGQVEARARCGRSSSAEICAVRGGIDIERLPRL